MRWSPARHSTGNRRRMVELVRAGRNLDDLKKEFEATPSPFATKVVLDELDPGVKNIRKMQPEMPAIADGNSHPQACTGDDLAAFLDGFASAWQNRSPA